MTGKYMTDYLVDSELALMSSHAGFEPTLHSSVVVLHVTLRKTAKRKNERDNIRSMMFLQQYTPVVSRN